MKCHHIYDEGVAVLIPGCIGSAVMGIHRCTCRNGVLKRPHPNDALVKELEKENARLNRIIKRLTKN